MFQVNDFAKYYKTNSLKANFYYESYAQRYVNYPKVTQWNWAAAFFGPFWLLYRKAYRAFLISFLAIMAVNVVFGPVITGLSGFAMFILFGLYGNNVYFWDIEARIVNHSQAVGTSHFLFVLLWLIFIPLALCFIGESVLMSLMFFVVPLYIVMIMIGYSAVWLFCIVPIVVGFIILASLFQ